MLSTVLLYTGIVEYAGSLPYVFPPGTGSAVHPIPSDSVNAFDLCEPELELELKERYALPCTPFRLSTAAAGGGDELEVVAQDHANRDAFLAEKLRLESEGANNSTENSSISVPSTVAPTESLVWQEASNYMKLPGGSEQEQDNKAGTTPGHFIYHPPIKFIVGKAKRTANITGECTSNL